MSATHGASATATSSRLSRRALVRFTGLYAVLAACTRQRTGPGPSPEAEQPITVQGAVTLDLGHYFGQGARWELIQRAAQRFEQEYPNIKVSIDPVAGDYWAVLTARFAGGTQPDILIGSGATFLGLLDKGAWSEVDGYLKRDKSIDLKNYYQQPDIFEYQSKHYGLPFMVNTTIFAYNKTLFDQEGVKPPTESWTWDDMLEAARRLSKPEQGQWGLHIGNGFEGNWLTFIWSAGGDYINKERTKTALDSPQTIEALQWLVDLKLRHRVSRPEGDTSIQGDPFSSGRVAMQSALTGAIGTTWLPTIGDKFQWDIFWRPKHPRTGKREGSFNGNPFLMTRTKQPDAAWLLLRHMAGPYVQGLIGETKIQMPTLISKATDPENFLKPPPASLRLNHELMATSRDLAFHRVWLEWYNAITAQIVPAFSGQISVKEAVQQAVQVGDAILQGGK